MQGAFVAATFGPFRPSDVRLALTLAIASVLVPGVTFWFELGAFA